MPRGKRRGKTASSSTDDDEPAKRTWAKGLQLLSQGKTKDALKWLSNALHTMRATFGGRHAETIEAMSELGRLSVDNGAWTTAEPWLREATQAKRETLGDEHPAVQASVDAYYACAYDAWLARFEASGASKET